MLNVKKNEKEGKNVDNLQENKAEFIGFVVQFRLSVCSRLFVIFWFQTVG
jgi:hypothetical protein